MNSKKMNRKEQGYTLLEYCAGAALIAGIVWVALSTMEQSLADFLNGISSWLGNRTAGISQT